jgi:phosphomannomutase
VPSDEVPTEPLVRRTTKAIVFDLDDTLAPSKGPLEPSMVTALISLLFRVPVCIISGGQFEQFRTQVLDRLAAAPESLLSRLHLMPTCGTRYYARRDHTWAQIYAEDLSPDQSLQIRQVLETCARSLGYWQESAWGDLIEDRGGQVTYSGLGQGAPRAAKAAWDPEGTKRRALQAEVAPLLADFEVRSGGSTSIDVTRRGIDKAYGMRRLMAQLHAAPHELLFVGDRLDVQGNDYPVLALGVPCISVTGWRDTLTVISQLDRWWDGRTEIPTFRILDQLPQILADPVGGATAMVRSQEHPGA